MGLFVAEIWHYLLDDEAEGPVSREQLQELAEAGVVTPDDLVWRKGTDDWIPAKKVRGLFPNGSKPTTSKPTRPAAVRPATNPPNAKAKANRPKPSADDEDPPQTVAETETDTTDDSQADYRPQAIPLPVLLIGLHAGATAAVTLMQSGQASSSVDLGSQLGSVTGMLGGLFGDALSEAGLPSTGATPELPSAISSGVGWFASVLAALTVPLIVFEAAVCYGLFTHQWWARRIALVTYLTPILIAIVSLATPVSLGSPVKLTVDALIAGGILFYLTRPAIRIYFGDEDVSWSSWIQRLRRTEQESE